MSQAFNFTIKRFLGLITSLMLMSCLVSPVLAETAGKIERIGGTFIVESIKPLKDGGFQVKFVAKDGEPKFKNLTLESSHVHMAITEGAVLRLSADVVATSGNKADVSQVVIFVPGKTGDTPVWMLSRRATVPNPPAKLLEMHAPQTDYQVF